MLLLLLVLQRASARRGARDDWATSDSLVHGGSRMDERGRLLCDRPLLSLFGGKWTLSCGPRAMAVENQNG